MIILKWRFCGNGLNKFVAHGFVAVRGSIASFLIRFIFVLLWFFCLFLFGSVWCESERLLCLSATIPFPT